MSVQMSITFSVCSWQVGGRLSLCTFLIHFQACVAGAECKREKYERKHQQCLLAQADCWLLASPDHAFHFLPIMCLPPELTQYLVYALHSGFSRQDSSVKM